MITDIPLRTSKNRTPITYYGGKQFLVPKLLPLIPKHDHYIEPFCGGSALFFGKDEHISTNETLNDTYSLVVSFYRQMQLNFDALLEEVESLPHSREIYHQYFRLFKGLKTNNFQATEFEKAVCFYVLSSQGFGSLVGKGWGMVKKDKKTSSIACANKIDTFKVLKHRLSRCQIEKLDAIDCIKGYDWEKSFFYVDPPYINTDCGHYDKYKVEDYENLLTTLSSIKGKFMLSSFPNEYLDNAITTYGWNTTTFTMNRCMRKATGYEAKKEQVVMNYTI